MVRMEMRCHGKEKTDERGYVGGTTTHLYHAAACRRDLDGQDCVIEGVAWSQDVRW